MPVPASFDYAVVRVVPRVERGEFFNAGVIVFCLSRDYLAARTRLDLERLRALDPEADVEAIAGHLLAIERVCQGEGPLGARPLRERFQWLTCPRSTVLQPSPVHSGLCDEPSVQLARLLRQVVPGGW